ncbi:anhydro-N-acetylmuramic acid kinase [Mariniflexile ostreae]|uniref:Anhydro-N-acetylmuramic acid kinase n=1 Tax=Mariniflexile ostreae TaxID=1520892 RepID=A0ABV5FDK7_9FLAO
MTKQKYKVIGVMSGTSLDGIDLALVSFNKDSNWTFKISHSETVPYEKEWRLKLSRLVDVTLSELKSIDDAYTVYLANVIANFIKKHNIKNLDAVCSHGHTALHQPEKKYTYQIGNKPGLATLIKQTVVCDFRVEDVALGGQGAPLVPIGDQLLFSEYDFCINLGGFANLSFDKDKTRVAYDICPVNLVLNHYANQLNLDFDAGGTLASKGKIDKNLLQKLNALSFYKTPPPKSLGLEWVHKNIFPVVDSLKLDTNTVLRTFVEHVAIQITSEINTKENASVLVTGGGTYNTFLISRIKSLTKNTISIPSNSIIEYKEALIFGFLGVLKLRKENNCLKSVTGAIHDHSSGLVFHY